MDSVMEFLFTAFLALIFSFLIAKLVSIAMAGDVLRDSGLRPCENVTSKKLQVVKDDKLLGESIRVEQKTTMVVGDGGTVEHRESEFVSDSVLIDAVDASKEKSVLVEAGENGGESGFGGLDKDAVNRGLDYSLPQRKEENPKDGEIWIEMYGDCLSVQQSEDVEPEILSKYEGSEKEDEDDWEGIERSDLEKVFFYAAKFVEGECKDELLANVSPDVLMRLYGLHKIATEGPCYEPSPMALKVFARGKWNAWQKLGNMSPEEAMEQYIGLLSENLPAGMRNIFQAAFAGAPDPNIDYNHKPPSSNESELSLKLGIQDKNTIGTLAP